jgi:UDP-N-acetylglucosamine/UDP-N-acetylgalactosamine diphosphorylase
MFAAWLQAAGVMIETDAGGLPPFQLEISPRFAVDRADFLRRWKALEIKPEIKSGCILK